MNHKHCTKSLFTFFFLATFTGWPIHAQLDRGFGYQGLPSFLAAYDADGDGQLSYSEQAAMQDGRYGLEDQRIEDFDLDKDGVLSPVESEEARNNLEGHIKTVRGLRFDEVDFDEDGVMTFEEFVDINPVYELFVDDPEAIVLVYAQMAGNHALTVEEILQPIRDTLTPILEALEAVRAYLESLKEIAPTPEAAAAIEESTNSIDLSINDIQSNLDYLGIVTTRESFIEAIDGSVVLPPAEEVGQVDTLESLFQDLDIYVGLDGLDGADGQNGQDGADGLDGADGQNSQDGADGLDGADGQNGQDGADGQDGQPGQPSQDLNIILLPPVLQPVAPLAPVLQPVAPVIQPVYPFAPSPGFGFP